MIRHAARAAVTTLGYQLSPLDPAEMSRRALTILPIQPRGGYCNRGVIALFVVTLPQRARDFFVVAFDTFYLRWQLCGGRGKELSMLKLAVSVTPFEP